MKVFIFTLLGLVFCSCTIENSQLENEIPNKINDSSKLLLRTIKTEYDIKSFNYNKDSTLHTIVERRNNEFFSKTEFVYNNNKVSEIIWEDVINKSKIKRVLEYKDNLLIKDTMLEENEVIAFREFFYNKNHKMIKQIQNIGWNDDTTKQTRIIDIYKVPGINEIQIKYNDVLSYIIKYDDQINPNSKIAEYTSIYASEYYGITNNILSITRLLKNGERDKQTSDLKFDSKGDYLLEARKVDNDNKLITKQIYTYN